MKKLLKKVENLMVAASFAEAGEHETAREILKEEKGKGLERKIGYHQRREYVES